MFSCLVGEQCKGSKGNTTLETPCAREHGLVLIRQTGFPLDRWVLAGKLRNLALGVVYLIV